MSDLSEPLFLCGINLSNDIVKKCDLNVRIFLISSETNLANAKWFSRNIIFNDVQF